MNKVPILFVIFNRLDTAMEAFAQIRKYQPDVLYLAADGPRRERPAEQIQCEETRSTILNAIDWDCNVHKLFREENLGCGRAVYEAINWMFATEEYGIVLEDDCVAKPSFFLFMEELLQRYKDDNRIGMIAGHNDLGCSFSSDSYIFSVYKACWGWATWKRAWLQMDFSMNWEKTSQCADVIHQMGYEGKDRAECLYKILKIKNGFVSAWDWQWYFSLASQSQLCIFPSKNLISNIGFGDTATHTKGKNKSNIIAEDLTFPLVHPAYVVAHQIFDRAFHNRMYSFKRRIRNMIPLSVYLYIYNKLNRK